MDAIDTDADRVPGAAAMLVLYPSAAPGAEVEARRAETSRRWPQVCVVVRGRPARRPPVQRHRHD